MTVDKDAAARELGAGLKALRTAAGLTVRAVAEVIGTSPANISNWEVANRLISNDRLIALLDALSPSADERERLLGLRRHAGGAGELVAGTTIGAPLAALIEQENTARRITEVALGLIPGLLQTRGYARAILAGESDIETKVALRMGRRDILGGADPTQLHAIIDSEVLVRPIANPPAMAEQLRHLRAMSERPNITIQVMRSTEPGFSPHLMGSFILLEFATATPIVHLEHLSGAATLWNQTDISYYTDAIATLTKRAMDPEASARLIAFLVNGLEH